MKPTELGLIMLEHRVAVIWCTLKRHEQLRIVDLNRAHESFIYMGMTRASCMRFVESLAEVANKGNSAIVVDVTNLHSALQAPFEEDTLHITLLELMF